jgi:hypothetical protein
MKRPASRPQSAVQALVEQHFSGHVPTVPPELAGDVRAELGRRVWTVTGLRGAAQLMRRLSDAPATERGAVNDAIAALSVAAMTHPPSRPPFPMPKAADPATAWVMALTIVDGHLLGREEPAFLFPAAGPEGCVAYQGDWGMSGYELPAVNWRKWQLPEDWHIQADAAHLAAAFARQMIEEAAAAGRPPRNNRRRRPGRRRPLQIPGPPFPRLARPPRTAQRLTVEITLCIPSP